MGFGDKKLAAPGPSLLSLSKSSMAQPITELRAPVTLEMGEHRPQRRHGKQGGCLLVPLTLLFSFSCADARMHTHPHTMDACVCGVGGVLLNFITLYFNSKATVRINRAGHTCTRELFINYHLCTSFLFLSSVILTSCNDYYMISTNNAVLLYTNNAFTDRNICKVFVKYSTERSEILDIQPWYLVLVVQSSTVNHQASHGFCHPMKKTVNFT